jgi:hypothetical protein
MLYVVVVVGNDEQPTQNDPVRCGPNPNSPNQSDPYLLWALIPTRCPSASSSMRWSGRWRKSRRPLKINPDSWLGYFVGWLSHPHLATSVRILTGQERIHTGLLKVLPTQHNHTSSKLSHLTSIASKKNHCMKRHSHVAQHN